MIQTLEYFATCPKGLEGLLLEEVKQLGAAQVRETVAGIYFRADLALAYRVCLWSRFANKVLLPLAIFEMKTAEDLYQGVRNIPWQEQVSPQGSLLVEFTGTGPGIRNSQFGAVKVKDAVVDCLRDFCGQRPSVARRDPDVRINARLSKGRLAVSLDLSGESLHRRGYRVKQGEAPLKENLAAAVLQRAGWPTLAAAGGALLDPMCGSGTLLIEGAFMAADIAPGLLRASFGFERWLNHRNDIWLEIHAGAIARRQAGLERMRNEIRGYDADVRVIRAAEANIVQAGLDDWIRITHKPLDAFKKPTHKPLGKGLVICNPPYGERLGEKEELKGLYHQLGAVLKAEFCGWRAGVFTGNPELGKQMGLRAQRKYKLFNGALPSELLVFDVAAEAFVEHRYESEPREDRGREPITPGAQMVANRLRKNRTSLAKWLNSAGVECYRLYDADLPEYAAAVDIYGDYVHVQEYAAPKTIDESKAEARFQEILAAIPVALNVSPDHISIKQRRRNRGKQQYERLASEAGGRQLTVREGPAKFCVDLWRYLDTGLFLDHRLVRQTLSGMVRGKRFLNLFCYTATATVHAALGGAASSVSVDMSKTYLDWARKNFALNNISGKQHHLMRADCLQWLNACREAFDVIFLDPPSFSNSKRMEGVLDVQRDHVQLIHHCMELLNPRGVLCFSCNLRSFKLDSAALSHFAVEDITARTIDRDFERNRKIHQCFLIRHKKHNPWTHADWP